MVDNKRPYRWMKGVATLSVIVLVASTAGMADAYAVRPKRHFLSWESLHRPEEYRRLRIRPKPLRRYSVSRRRVVKLRKSSFWNKRPYQFSIPLLDDGRLYVGVDAGYFYAVDTARQSKIWTFETEGPVHCKAAVEDGIVYIGDSKANVYAIDAATGKRIWKAQLDTEILAQPLVFEDRLYIVTMSGRLYAMDRSSGVDTWHTDPHERAFGFSIRRASAPIMYKGAIYFGTSSGLVVAYRASDGSIAWARQLGGRRSHLSDVDCRPLVIGDKLWVASADGNLFALDPDNGRVLLVLDFGGPNDILHHEGRLYATGAGVVSALNLETGNISWQQDLETPEISTPAGGKGYIAVVSTEDKLYLIDSRTGDVVFERYVRRGSYGDPIVAGERLYVLSNTGRLFSFKVREIPARKR